MIFAWLGRCLCSGMTGSSDPSWSHEGPSGADVLPRDQDGSLSVSSGSAGSGFFFVFIFNWR